jgi:hypothetical protein
VAGEKEKKGTFGLDRRHQYIILAVLGAAFGGLLIYRAGGSGDASAAAVEQAAESAKPEPVTLPPPVPPLPPEPVACIPPEELPRDPFLMPADLRSKLQQQRKTDEDGHGVEIPGGPDPLIIKQAHRLTLKGIMGSAGDRIAFIDDEALRVQGTIAGFTIIKIRERSVLLEKEQTELELKLENGPPNAPENSEAP